MGTPLCSGSTSTRLPLSVGSLSTASRTALISYQPGRNTSTAPAPATVAVLFFVVAAAAPSPPPLSRAAREGSWRGGGGGGESQRVSLVALFQ